MKRLRMVVLFALAASLNGADSSECTRFILAGDSIINRRLSVSNAPGFPGMIDRIRKADAAFTNFETLIHDFESPGEALSGGTYMGSPAWVVDELKWAGFNLLSVANNHAFDFGVEGMRSTRRALDRSGIAFAGSGETLARARAPAYLDTRKGRVALLACASTFPPASAAGRQRIDLPGRPGVNPLRFSTTYTVDPGTYHVVQQLAAMSTTGPVEHPLKFLGAFFEEGKSVAVHTKAYPADLQEITDAIRDARRQADWVIVPIHAHEGAPGQREIPAEFLVEFAHRAVDAGADIVVGHGPHLLRGIEVYAHKPIFYSLGDFIFQNDTVRFQPAESYDQFGLAASALPADFYDARSQNDTRSYPAEPLFWSSVIAEAVFDGNRNLERVLVYPISLGFKRPRTRRGLPYPASEEEAKTIVGRLAKLSSAFGTSIRYEQGSGVVSWRAN